jgi:hypothetical protein
MSSKLEPVSTPEGAKEILQRMIESGKLTIEDLDTPSDHWQENYDFAAKHYPEIKLTPWRNLLRDNDDDSRETDPRQISRVRAQVSQVLRPEKESIRSKKYLGHSEEVGLSGELPF